MAEAEALSRKKKVRAAHRGSVTRIIGQVRENLEGEDVPNLTKLRQQKLSLSGKVDVLSRLDDELIEMVEEEELDYEIEQADVIQERIGMCIMDIDQALKRATEDDLPGTVPAVDAAAVTTPTTAAVIATCTPTTAVATPTLTLSTGAVTATTASSSGLTTTGIVTPSTGSGSSILTTTPITSLAPHTDPLPTHTHVRLPKLSIRRFSGDLTKWVTFWDSFNSSIHENPTLSSIDKFNYLNSYLESEAADAISGLTLTAANYEEAVATLKRRFGNKQLIVNRHMDLLLNLDAVVSQHNLKGLRHLFDIVESNVRGLRALGVPPDTYGGLLSSILMSKLPPELRLIISRELSEADWDLDSMMKIIQREVEARERSAGNLPSASPRRPQGRGPQTALSLMTGASTQMNCVYRNHPHPSNSCPTITSSEARKQILGTAGRCFVCLRRGHICRYCRSTNRCTRCRGRHHISICSAFAPGAGRGSPTTTASNEDTRPSAEGMTRTPSTSAMYVNSHTPILLQTAKVVVCDATHLEPTSSLEVRAILDPGSQRSYVTTHVREKLSLRRIRSESMIIKTFGSDKEDKRTCDVVELGILTKLGTPQRLTVVVVPHICDPVHAQPISAAKQMYKHISGLDLADSAEATGKLEIDVLIGSDQYWGLVTGRVGQQPLKHCLDGCCLDQSRE